MTTKQEIIDFIGNPDKYDFGMHKLIDMINDLKPEIRVKKLGWKENEEDFKYVTLDGMYKILLDEDLNKWNCYFLENGFDTTDTIDEAHLAAQKHHEQCILGQIEL